jgi:hypothetical protein
MDTDFLRLAFERLLSALITRVWLRILLCVWKRRKITLLTSQGGSTNHDRTAEWVMNDLPEIAYELSLTGPGITITKSVDAERAGAIAQIAMGGAVRQIDRLATGPTVLRAGPVDPGRPLSLREFLQRMDLSIGIHAKILAVGRYMRDFENLPDFTRDDVRSRFRGAGEPQPGNFPRDFQKAVRAGWIAEDPKSAGRFYVTRTGDELTDQGFRSAVS